MRRVSIFIRELFPTRRTVFSSSRTGVRFPFPIPLQKTFRGRAASGSSATIRLGILLALNRLSGNPLDRFTIFRLCAELEGHPDNAAPATFGGFTVVQGRAIVSGSTGPTERSPRRPALRSLAPIAFRSVHS